MVIVVYRYHDYILFYAGLILVNIVLEFVMPACVLNYSGTLELRPPRVKANVVLILRWSYF